MSERGITTIARIIMDAIYDHALGNPEALAGRIVAALVTRDIVSSRTRRARSVLSRSTS
jgi:hypothetical protein